EYQVIGFKVKRFFNLLRRRLVRMAHSLRIRFQVNQHPALAAHIARARIVLELIPGNAVEAAGVLAVDNDLDVVQVSSSTLFELNRFGSAHRKLGAALLRLGDRKALGRLLNVQSKFGGNSMDGLAQTPLR